MNRLGIDPRVAVNRENRHPDAGRFATRQAEVCGRAVAPSIVVCGSDVGKEH
jgi:hypothetical protein